MIYSLLLTYVTAASNGLICEQVFDPAYCKGPAAGAPGLECAWQPNEFECKAINMMNPEDACKILSHNQPACEAKPECHYEPFDGECKGHEAGDVPDYMKHGGQAAVLPTAHTMPAGPAQTGAFPTGGSLPAAGSPPAAGGVVPGASPVNPTPIPAQVTPATARPVAPLPASTMKATTRAPEHRPSPPQTRPPVAPQPPVAPPVAPQPPVAPSVVPPVPPRTTPRFCKMLMQAECFGPSSSLGKLCYWDAEDMECSEATRGSVEAICKQFARDPAACDSHENCFWDQKDYECSEIEFGMHFHKPVMTEICSNYNSNVNACASRASCFFDTASNMCVNVVQATNVCGVYKTPDLCSTNRLCSFQNGLCSPAPYRGAGLHLQSAHQEGTEPTSTTTPTSDYFVMFACGFSGSLLGLLFALGMQRMCQRKPSQEDYRDIVLDVNSHRRQVV